MVSRLDRKREQALRLRADLEMVLDLLVEPAQGVDFGFESGMVVAVELQDGDDLDHTGAKARVDDGSV